MVTTTTYSMWSTFRNCRRQCAYRYIDGLRPIGDKAESLLTGDLVHRCLEKWYTTSNVNYVQQLINADEEVDQVGRSRRWQVTTAMMEAYIENYPTDLLQWNFLGLELPFTADIHNPATGAMSRSFIISGKVDGVIQTEDGIFILEHKTASRIDAAYLDKLWSDMQIQLYSHFIEKAYGWKISGVLYNILAKPSSQMKQKGGETDEEFADRISTAKAPGRCRQQMAESDEEFQERLAEWYADAPQERFHREILYFTTRDIEDLQSELWELTQQYLTAQRTDDGRGFYRNTSQCWMYNHPCDFLPICRSHDNQDMVINSFFTKESDMHPELAPAELPF
jgi:hypothetical protein